MIAGIFHQGSGLGNQLHRYVMTRVLAEDKGYEFGMLNHENFKGDSFMYIDKGGKDIDFPSLIGLQRPSWNEKKVVENGVDIRGYDPEINFVPDNTIIDGEFQDERYFEHRFSQINSWLQVEPLYLHRDTCVIGFRGGEYSIFPDLYLPADYWEAAIMYMLKMNKKMQFEVHTDDTRSAMEMLEPLFFKRGLKVEYIHDIARNWRAVRHAHHLIIANSSFYILPALLNSHCGEVKRILAPRYWARHNTQVWALPQNYYKEFTYI